MITCPKFLFLVWGFLPLALGVFGHGAAIAADAVDFFMPLVSEVPATLGPDQPFGQASDVIVTLKPSAHVALDRIYLGDIGDCTGAEAQCAETYGIDLGPAPRPGATLTLEPKGVELRLREEIKRFKMRVEGAGNVRVEADYVKIDAPVLKERLLAEIAKLNQDSPWRIELKQLVMGSERRIRPGEYKLRYPLFEERDTRNLDWVLSRLNGLARLDVIVESSRQVELLTVQAQLSVWVHAIVAKRDLREQAPLASDDFEISWKKPALNNVPWVKDVRDLEGKVFKRAVRTGELILSSMVSRPILVRRGQNVALLVSSGGLKLAARGQALDAGGKDDTIEVQHQESKKKMFGRIVDRSTVEVSL